MARILLKGEVHWADWKPVRCREQAGLRPLLILSEPTAEGWIPVESGASRKKIAVLDDGTLGQLIDGLLELVG